MLSIVATPRDCTERTRLTYDSDDMQNWFLCTDPSNHLLGNRPPSSSLPPPPPPPPPLPSLLSPSFSSLLPPPSCSQAKDQQGSIDTGPYRVCLDHPVPRLRAANLSTIFPSFSGSFSASFSVSIFFIVHPDSSGFSGEIYLNFSPIAFLPIFFSSLLSRYPGRPQSSACSDRLLVNSSCFPRSAVSLLGEDRDL